jgi:sRNA-binding regulator protein Hfq
MMKISDIKKQKNNSWTFLIDGFEMLIEIFSHNNYSIMIYNNTVGGYE